MRETRTYGVVRGASSNGRPYRNPYPTASSTMVADFINTIDQTWTEAYPHSRRGSAKRFTKRPRQPWLRGRPFAFSIYKHQSGSPESF